MDSDQKKIPVDQPGNNSNNKKNSNDDNSASPANNKNHNQQPLQSETDMYKNLQDHSPQNNHSNNNGHIKQDFVAPQPSQKEYKQSKQDTHQDVLKHNGDNPQDQSIQSNINNNNYQNNIVNTEPDRPKQLSCQYQKQILNPVQTDDVDLQMESGQNVYAKDNVYVKNSNQQYINDQQNNSAAIQPSQFQQNQGQQQDYDEEQKVPEHLQQEPQLDVNSEWWKEWTEEKKLKVNENYQIFRIPKIKQSIEDSNIIGVIDQSGSMGDCFAWLAKEWNTQIKEKYEKTKVCIFHNLAYEADQLQEDPEMGTTDVEAGFTLLNNSLQQDDVQDNVTIIFVSDGQDNNQDTIFQRLDNLVTQIPTYKKINFITIGVGEAFPTYLAMQLRQMYHTGENNIPPVFLVYNQHVHDNWKVTFNIVNKYLKHNDPLITQQPTQEFPWYRPSNFVYENSWTFVKDINIKSIIIEDQEIQPVQKLTPQEVLDIGSLMASNIQLSNLKHKNDTATEQQAIVAQQILANLKQKWWGKGRKKYEEKEQLTLIENELEDLEQNPDLNNGDNVNEKDKDQNLALKLAVGAIGAGVGLYWLSNNYGDFAGMMGQMDFSGQACCGECGMCDQVAQCMGCDNCGQCCGDIIATGEDCIGGFCECFYAIMESACSCICSLLE